MNYSAFGYASAACSWYGAPDLNIKPIDFPYCESDTYGSPRRCDCNDALEWPNIPDGPMCPCIPNMSATSSASATIDNGCFDLTPLDKPVPTMTISISNTASDCCNPKFEIDYDLTIPCMPFVLKPNAIVIPIGEFETPRASFTATKNCGCEYALDLTLWLPERGPLPTGACCTGEVCSVLTEDACTTGGGVYKGNNVACTETMCLSSGACCLATTCYFVTRADCDKMTGSDWAKGTPCRADTCGATDSSRCAAYHGTDNVDCVNAATLTARGATPGAAYNTVKGSCAAVNYTYCSAHSKNPCHCLEPSCFDRGEQYTTDRFECLESFCCETYQWAYFCIDEVGYDDINCTTGETPYPEDNCEFFLNAPAWGTCQQDPTRPFHFRKIYQRGGPYTTNELCGQDCGPRHVCCNSTITNGWRCFENYTAWQCSQTCFYGGTPIHDCIASLRTDYADCVNNPCAGPVTKTCATMGAPNCTPNVPAGFITMASCLNDLPYWNCADYCGAGFIPCPDMKFCNPDTGGVYEATLTCCCSAAPGHPVCEAEARYTAVHGGGWTRTTILGPGCIPQQGAPAGWGGYVDTGGECGIIYTQLYDVDCGLVPVVCDPWFDELVWPAAPPITCPSA